MDIFTGLRRKLFVIYVFCLLVLYAHYFLLIYSLVMADKIGGNVLTLLGDLIDTANYILHGLRCYNSLKLEL